MQTNHFATEFLVHERQGQLRALAPRTTGRPSDRSRRRAALRTWLTRARSERDPARNLPVVPAAASAMISPCLGDASPH
jgi:hypothetical protein